MVLEDLQAACFVREIYGRRLLISSEKLGTKISDDPSVQLITGFWLVFSLQHWISPLGVHPANRGWRVIVCGGRGAARGRAHMWARMQSSGLRVRAGLCSTALLCVTPG